MSIASGTDFDSLPDVLTAKEVGEFLRIGRNSLYEAIRRGEIASVKVGGCLRIPKSVVREILLPNAA